MFYLLYGPYVKNSGSKYMQTFWQTTPTFKRLYEWIKCNEILFVFILFSNMSDTKNVFIALNCSFSYDFEHVFICWDVSRQKVYEVDF